MSGHGGIIASLREVGYRLTPQRMLIISIIHDSKGHISAEDVHQRVKEQYPFVDISTVYRNLQLLKRLHIVTETDLGGGSVRYELSQDERHHHLVCRVCGKTFALDDAVIEPLRSALMDAHGFAADMEHFAIFGRCRACRSET
jgi:Fur family ferric uptake transcriptional regulator